MKIMSCKGSTLLPSLFIISNTGCIAGFALPGKVLFFASPKKSTQKKGDPEGLPAKSSAMNSRVPCASRRFGTVITSPLRRLARQDLPRLPASKSSSTRRLALVLKSRCAGFGCDARQRLTGFDAATPGPVARAEYRSQVGRMARTLSEASRSGIGQSRSGSELCAPPAWRGTQGTGASRRGRRVPFSLGTFSWAHKRKYLAR